MEIRNIIRRILNEEFLNEEMSEYARTLKNARKQGSGLRFPKSAIKANPNRFRPYSREQVDETNTDEKITCKCGWSWNLKDGGNDPYTCHKCGHINSMTNLNEEETDIGEKSKFEKTLANIVEKRLPEIIKDNNFYGVAVDVYNSSLGKTCHITILLNKSFKMEDADEIQSNSREIKEFVKSIVGNIFKGGISIGVSTLDSYNDTRWYYESKKGHLS